MSERAPYSRVYWSIVDDPKFAAIYDDDRHLATWLRLLVIAEGAHPSSALIPYGTRKASLVALVEAGLVDLGVGNRYRIHGLVSERRKRSEEQRNGGHVRMEHARRGPDGRLLPNTTAGPPLVTTAGDQRNQLRRDELRQDETSTAPDPWDDPEHDVSVWLSKHGCIVRPGDGFHRKLVTAVEVHGAAPLIEMMDRLAGAGTNQGDIKGFLFGAIDALYEQSRPSLTALAKADRVEDEAAATRRRVEATRRYAANLRGEAS